MKSKTFFITLLILMIFLPLNVLATTASSNEIYEGIDVSDWQGYIDYSQVKSSGIEIVYIKASQGDNIVDSYFRINYRNAKENGLKVGFYHFLTARNEEEAIRQAEFFASVISNTSPDCKLAMDFEVFDGLSVSEINRISEAFLERVREITGREVIIYSDAYNARNVFGEELANNYSLWIAEYGTDVLEESNWEYWEGFQYTSRGIISGIRGYVDRDKFTAQILLDDRTAISPTGATENYTHDEVYIVQRGDTLSAIALKYGTTVSELVTLNKISNPDLIYPDERVIVPINGNIGNEVKYDTRHIVYTVRRGDTLSEIALRFGTTVQSIAELNHITNVNLIYIGERLRIVNY